MGIFALLATMTFGIASCQLKNEPTNQPTNGQTDKPTNEQTETDEPTIIGMWKYVLMERFDGEDTSIMSFDGEDDYFIFNKDNSGTMIWPNQQSYKFSYTLVGEKLILEYSEVDLGTMIYTIKELTKDVLVLKLTEGTSWVELTLKRVK